MFLALTSRFQSRAASKKKDQLTRANDSIFYTTPGQFPTMTPRVPPFWPTEFPFFDAGHAVPDPFEASSSTFPGTFGIADADDMPLQSSGVYNPANTICYDM